MTRWIREIPEPSDLVLLLRIFQVSSPEDIQRIVQMVVETTAKIIVVFSSDVDLSPLVTELLRHNVTNHTWIATEAWVTSALMLQPGVSLPANQSVAPIPNSCLTF